MSCFALIHKEKSPFNENNQSYTENNWEKKKIYESFHLHLTYNKIISFILDVGVVHFQILSYSKNTSLPRS